MTAAETKAQKPTSTRRLVVQKFGGMSLATPEQIQQAANRVAELRHQGFNVIAVVSAMGKTTDQLIDLAYAVSPNPNRRELDMLLSTGERVSMALFSMALNDALSSRGLGAKAVSFTGSQAGILTDDAHSNARIIDVRPIRVQEEIDRGNVVILAGFQGVSPTTKEITTLGRGGTDVTAVALAVALQADRCEILKEVEGVMTADPARVAKAHLIPDLSLRELADLTFWGAKVLHYRSAELAATHQIPLRIALAHPGTAGAGQTEVPVQASQLNPESASHRPAFENESILSVNSHSLVHRVTIAPQPTPQAHGIATGLESFESALIESKLPLPQILECRLGQNSEVDVFFTAPAEALDAQLRYLKTEPARKKGLVLDSHVFATVSATCRGEVSKHWIARLASALHDQNVPVHQLLVGALTITFFIDSKDRDSAIRILHSFVL